METPQPTDLPAHLYAAARRATDMEFEPLTTNEVRQWPGLYAAVREQAACIRRDLARHGAVVWAGTGYHRDCRAARDFAVRVLEAKGEIVADPTDPRRWVAGGK